MTWRRLVAAVVAGVAALALPVGGASAAEPATFQVGTAVVDITPTAPQYLGGYDQMDTPTADVHDPLQARAFFVAHGSHAVGFVAVDTQGWFAGYQEGPYGARDAAKEAARWLRGHGYDAHAGNLLFSSSHSHAAPTIMGIWGPTDPDYLKQVHDGAVEALEAAASNTHDAELWTANGSIDTLIAQNVEGTDHFDGWGVDDQTPVLWARKPATGATLGLYANVPVHPDQFRGSKYRQMSADYPGYVRKALDEELGGTAVIAEGTLGRQEAMGGRDDYSEVERQGAFITNAIERALAHAKPITDSNLAGAETYLTVPAHNAALLALLYLNTQGFQCSEELGACTIDRSIEPPYLAGNVIGTWVTTVRIGNDVWFTEPGEAFPEVSTAIRDSIQGAGDVNVVGMSQDQLGYFYPPEDYPASEVNPSEFIIYNVGPALADQTVDAAAVNANRIGFTGVPQHPTMDDEQPHAYFEPGTQFWPGVMESANPSVEFLGDAKASLSPTLPGQPPHTVSPITWDFGDGTGATSGNDERITHTFPGPGSYEVTSTVHDEQGQVRTWSQTVIVDPPPVATVDRERHGTRATLTAGVQGGDGHVIAAHWSFGDGTTADGITVTHRRPGTVTVTIVDGAGDEASKTVRF
jgi:hypothetical protein